MFFGTELVLLTISVMIVGLYFLSPCAATLFFVGEDISESMAISDTISGANIAFFCSFFDDARRWTGSTSAFDADIHLAYGVKSASFMALLMVRFGDLIGALRRR